MITQRKTFRRTLCITALLFLLYLSLLLSGPTISVLAFESTQVFVNPATQTVSAQETFIVTISCVPGQPIKAFELKVSFNPTLLQANSVSEGNIFTGHTTFFNAGIINNVAGTIINIYDLIIGPENVSSPGSLITISFTAKTVSGTSILDLLNVGVTNEVGYVSLIVSDGSVTVLGENQPPALLTVSPSNGSTGVSVGTSSLSVLIQDPEGDPFNWSITTGPNIGHNAGNAASNGIKTCSVSGLSYSTTYHWYVSCKDVDSGEWMNASYQFTTATEPQGGGSPGGGGYTPPDQNNEQPPTSNDNTPPYSPGQPEGPEFIERGVSYSYSSSGFDPDGDSIRLRFDWGDGIFSDWSVFVSANTSVSSSHAWSSPSSFSIRAIAQDENGTNSSWSIPVNVTVSEDQEGDNLPVPEINAPENASTNSTILFDASGSYDPDGVIVSYLWDFGDGITGTGMNTAHSYKKPGVYSVVLTVTDNNGNTYQKTFTVTVQAGAEALSTDAGFPIIYILVIGIVLLLIIGLIVGRKKLLISRVREIHTKNKIAKLDAQMQKLTPQTDVVPKTSKDAIGDKRHQIKTETKTIEQEVDDVIAAKIREKIDKM
jgi:PKD repeat protein